MGKPDKCLITDLETFEINDSRDVEIQYYINPPDLKKIKLMFSGYAEHWTDIHSKYFRKDKLIIEYIKEKISSIKHILTGLILNNKWPIEEIILDSKMIDKIINESDYPKTPQDKLDDLFLKLFKLQSYDGSTIDTFHLFDEDNNFLKSLYFKNSKEALFYFTYLVNDNIINAPTRNIYGHYAKAIFTFKGIQKAIKLTEQGQFSNNCFVAMSFDKEEDSIFFESIEPACDITGFAAKRIDYENYDSDKTITDAIISLLKQCRFCIADFTKQKDGVYFEAGYALGRGMKVIYTCRKDYFDKSHFDTNHFPHIVYETNEELKKKLIDKINAFIKD